jgi:hypothetical protein
MNRKRSAAVPAASSRTVSVRDPEAVGGTPPELAGEDACATGFIVTTRVKNLRFALPERRSSGRQSAHPGPGASQSRLTSAATVKSATHHLTQSILPTYEQ